jgi:hypothetical protein
MPHWQSRQFVFWTRGEKFVHSEFIFPSFEG